MLITALAMGSAWAADYAATKKPFSGLRTAAAMKPYKICKDMNGDQYWAKGPCFSINLSARNPPRVHVNGTGDGIEEDSGSPIGAELLQEHRRRNGLIPDNRRRLEFDNPPTYSQDPKNRRPGYDVDLGKHVAFKYFMSKSPGYGEMSGGRLGRYGRMSGGVGPGYGAYSYSRYGRRIPFSEVCKAALAYGPGMYQHEWGFSWGSAQGNHEGEAQYQKPTPYVVAPILEHKGIVVNKKILREMFHTENHNSSSCNTEDDWNYGYSSSTDDSSHFTPHYVADQDLTTKIPDAQYSGGSASVWPSVGNGSTVY